MKAVALLVVYMGYVLVAYGVNHVTGGCVSFKDTVLPVGGSISDPCNGSGTTGSTSQTGSQTPSSTINNGGPATSLPGSGSPSGSGHPTTIPAANPQGYYTGTTYRKGNPYHLSFTSTSGGS